MSRYADVIVDITHESLDHSFQYRIPPELEEKIVPGSQVKLPFGKGNRLVTGYVIAVSTQAKCEESRIKDICGEAKDAVTVEANLISLAAWMRYMYGSTMIQALKTVLPVKNRVKPKEIRQIVLCMERKEAEETLQELQRRNRKAQARLLAYLLEEPSVPYTESVKQLKLSADTLKRMEEAGLLRIETVQSDTKKGCLSTGQQAELRLNPAQTAAAEGILGEWQGSNRPCLLQGVTGSGKTVVYMKLIEHVLREGKQAIVLIPEISLTYQNVERFRRVFGERVAFLNSKMTQTQRAEQMEKAAAGQVAIMVGPRSALFTPFPKLGLIIIDEEHETSYKSETTPRYHARETAIKRAELEQAHIVLGSATPSVDSYAACRAGEYALFTLQERYGGAALPQVWIVDMREELKNGNRQILSTFLEEQIERRLQKGEQSLLFLNRRGYAGFISCRSCGQVIRCSHCDVSMTAHNDGMLVCHYCGSRRPQPRQCPSCGSPYIGGFRAGTQQIEQLVQKKFPNARILRMDADTTKTRESYEKILSAFAAGEADILIGTQMIVKGHDFPNVTLVGALAADLSLNAADYRAGERTFQLLTQAVGRAGRKEKKGMAVIQTYQPEHYSIRAAAVQDYPAFYREEIAYRQLMEYPPVGNLLAVRTACEDETHLEQAMTYIRRYLEKVCGNSPVRLIGPAKESVAKINDLYRYVLYAGSDHKEAILALRERLEQYIRINSGFSNIYVQFDLN